MLPCQTTAGRNVRRTLSRATGSYIPTERAHVRSVRVRGVTKTRNGTEQARNVPYARDEILYGGAERC